MFQGMADLTSGAVEIVSNHADFFVLATLIGKQEIKDNERESGGG